MGTITGTGEGIAVGGAGGDPFVDVQFLGTVETEQLVTLRYTFTPIPEPTTISLAALGLLSLAVARRRSGSPSISAVTLSPVGLGRSSL
jgi:hypothetical protein